MARINNFKTLLGDGTRYGINIIYKIQDKPRGLPDAFNLGKSFINDENVALILGDNFFYGQSLTQKLENDEILAVAFQYTVGNQVFQVGEFANDGVQATQVTNNVNDDNIQVNSNNLILKLLKSTVTSVDEPMWDLMMKNIYNTGAFQLEKEDFK